MRGGRMRGAVVGTVRAVAGTCVARGRAVPTSTTACVQSVVSDARGTGTDESAYVQPLEDLATGAIAWWADKNMNATRTLDLKPIDIKTGNVSSRS